MFLTLNKRLDLVYIKYFYCIFPPLNKKEKTTFEHAIFFIFVLDNMYNNCFHERNLMDHCVEYQRVYVVVERGHIYSCWICYWKIAGSGDFLKVRANCL